VTDSISIKYRLDEIAFDLWYYLVEESVAHRKNIDFVLPGRDISEKSYEDFRSQTSNERYWEAMKERINEWEIFVSSLSGVDGAVVLTRKLKVLGFGVEILTPSQGLSTVKVASDPYGNYREERHITSFGTRHRSALRLCTSFEDCLSFVVSQDGAVRAMKQVGSDLLMWDDVNLNQFSL
jgi:hypothetical protein